MPIIEPIALTFPPDSLAGFVTPQSLAIHYEKHYLKYIQDYNKDFSGDSRSIPEAIQQTVGHQQELAGQIMNHEMFWNQFTPTNNNKHIPLDFFTLIQNTYGTVANLVSHFNMAAEKHFGSGWIWLAADRNRSNLLMILDGKDGYNPLQDGFIPLLTLDLWEHAYYLDYLTDRNKYIVRFWDHINWSIVRNRAFMVMVPGRPITTPDREYFPEYLIK